MPAKKPESKQQLPSRSQKSSPKIGLPAASKQSRIVEMLKSPTGTTIDKIVSETGWQEHSVRGFLSGIVRKKLKLNLGSKLVNGNRIYLVTNQSSRRARNAV
jgi:Protein of unknown function (DUF3489)